jgi:nucleotide-binding universal stress UspA family protein
MPGWNKILCPIDFSETARVAMIEGLEIAKRHGAQLFLLHVLEERWPAGRGDLLTPPELAAKFTDTANRDMAAWKQVADQIAPGRVVTQIASGHAATEILRVARQGDFDLIVMGTHGRRGLRRLVVGSVADEISRSAPCSVTVVRPKMGGEFDVAPD